ncbi:MAG TPA: hypothetical protein VFX49_10600 [Chloroflexota bacterium]|nr:hypothetical protein [Chloroflexota bacterium]
MEIPAHRVRTATYYPDARYRVDVNRALRDWKSLRRAQRVGGATYRDVREARHLYARAQRAYTATWLTDAGEPLADA